MAAKQVGVQIKPTCSLAGRLIAQAEWTNGSLRISPRLRGVLVGSVSTMVCHNRTKYSIYIYMNRPHGMHRIFSVSTLDFKANQPDDREEALVNREEALQR